MEKRYHLPVEAMIAIMASSRQSVLLLAHLPALAGFATQGCLARIVLEQGALRTCLIIRKSGVVLLQNQGAYAALLRCGDLEWRVIRPADLAASGPAQSVMGASEHTQWGIPRLRVTSLHRDLLTSFPRSQRVVLVLVDGKRSIEEIAHLLSKSPHDIQQMLADIGHLVQL